MSALRVPLSLHALDASGDRVGVLELWGDPDWPPAVVRDQAGSTWVLEARGAEHVYRRAACGEATLRVRE